jgi:WD40 repeat protein
LISANDQGTLHIWDYETGTLLRSCKGHEGVVHSVAFSSDGKWLVSGSMDRTVRLWLVATGEEQRRFGDSVDSVKCVAFSPGCRLIAASTGDYEGFTVLWEVNTGREVARLPATQGHVSQIAFSPDGKLLAGTGADNTLCLWEIVTRSERLRWEAQSGGGLAIAFSPDGRSVAAASQDTSVVLWDVAHCGHHAYSGTEHDFNQLWADLGSGDAKLAHQAICMLLVEPQSAVRLFGDRLGPSPQWTRRWWPRP